MTNSDVRITKLEVTDRYQKSVNFILTLSAGTLVFSTIFLRDMIGIGDDTLISGCLQGIVSSWICLVLSVMWCILYYFSSSKFVRSLYEVKLSRFWKNHAEALCHWSFGLSVIFFGFGIVYFILYVYFVNFRFG